MGRRARARTADAKKVNTPEKKPQIVSEQTIAFVKRKGRGLGAEALAAVASVGLSVALASFPGFGLDKTSALGGALGVPRNAEGADSEAYLQALRHGPAWPSES